MSLFRWMAENLFDRLAWTSLQAALLIGLVWLIVRLLPHLSAAMRSLLWWLVGAQLMLGLLTVAPVQLPWLPAISAHATTTSADDPRNDTAPLEATANYVPAAWRLAPPSVARIPLTQTAMPTAVAPTVFTAHNVRLALIWLWFASVLAQLAWMARDWRMARAVLRDSLPLRDPQLQALCAERVAALNLRRVPALRVSHAITSPQVTGLWRPVVLLPASQRLTPDESSLALAHELAHLRRGDLWLSWIPTLAQRLFFFHPLVAWAMREYALNREAACDADVMRQLDAPQDYGRLLLRLGVAHPLHSGLAGASPSFQNLKRRLTMLQQTLPQPTTRLRGWLLVAFVALVGVLPYRVTAGSASDNPPSTQAGELIPPSPPAPPPPPPPPAPPFPPPPPPPPKVDTGFSAHHVSITTHDSSDYGYALLDRDSVFVNGTDGDLSTVKHLQQGTQPLLWVRQGDKAYVVRDAAYIQRAKDAFAPLNALSREQGLLGGQQGRLGGLQGALGARQGALGARQGRLASQKARLAALTSLDSKQDALKSNEQALDASESELSKQQDELGKQQEELGRQQEALGAKQEALGKRQEEASEQAQKQLKALLDEAIAKGAAQSVAMG